MWKLGHVLPNSGQSQESSSSKYMMIVAGPVLGRLGIASIFSHGKSSESHQNMWSALFMNSLATGDYGDFMKRASQFMKSN
jgi:hypothetical protein